MPKRSASMFVTGGYSIRLKADTWPCNPTQAHRVQSGLD
jgi:hypothetical protein